MGGSNNNVRSSEETSNHPASCRTRHLFYRYSIEYCHTAPRTWLSASTRWIPCPRRFVAKVTHHVRERPRAPEAASVAKAMLFLLNIMKSRQYEEVKRIISNADGERCRSFIVRCCSLLFVGPRSPARVVSVSFKTSPSFSPSLGQSKICSSQHPAVEYAHMARSMGMASCLSTTDSCCRVPSSSFFFLLLHVPSCPS